MMSDKDPELDSDGFPTCLYRVRVEVEARDGVVERISKGRWILSNRSVPNSTISIYFHDDGWVEVGFGRHPVMLSSPEDAYSTDFGDGALTGLESSVIGILDGGYRECVILDDKDVFVGDGFEFDFPGQAGGRMPEVTGEARQIWWTYPAWPRRRE